MKSYYLVMLIFILVLFGCEKFDQAVQDAEKVRTAIGDTEKKITETKERAQKSLDILLGKGNKQPGDKESAKTEARESENKED